MRTINNQSLVNWAAYSWPAWVPDSVRVLVEYIWPSPLDWQRNTKAVQAPRLGAAVHLPLPEAGRVVAGNYVHIRGLVGRVVDRDRPGRVYVVELDEGQPKARFE